MAKHMINIYICETWPLGPYRQHDKTFLPLIVQRLQTLYQIHNQTKYVHMTRKASKQPRAHQQSVENPKSTVGVY